MKKRLLCLFWAVLFLISCTWGVYASEEGTGHTVQLLPLELVDFVVNVEEGRMPRIMVISDTQIIESEQMRNPDRLAEWQQIIWSKTRKEDNCYGYVRKAVKEYKPDLIIIPGDFVYGQFDDSGEAFVDQINFFDSLQVPWAPVFGNHDNESKKGVDWQCDQLEASKYCLFRQRELTGNGNYTVGISQGNKLKRVFVMLDSNGCGGASAESLANGHTTSNIGFGQDQIEWYKAVLSNIKEISPETKFSAVFHIQLSVMNDAIGQYGEIPLNLYEIGRNGDYGYINAPTKLAWDSDKTVYNGLKTLGFDSIINGHEHWNNGGLYYDGVRFIYGLKSSTYDRYNSIASDGRVVTEGGAIPYVGGTAIDMAADGTICNIYHVVSSVTDNAESSGVSKTKNFDFNGTDFDATVTIPNFTQHTANFASDASSIPFGYSGGVYQELCDASDSLTAVGLKFGDNFEFESIESFKVRMYVTEYTPTKAPLLRTYYDGINATQAKAEFSDCGGVQGEWCEVEIKDIITKYINDGKLDDFVLAYRYYSNGTEKPMCYFDSVTITYTEKPAVKIFDFNGTDFDATVTIPNFTQHTANFASDASSIPFGYSGGVYQELCDASDSLTAVGLKFGDNFEFESIESFKVRMYVTEYTPTKAPLLRTYYDGINATQAKAEFSDCGGVQGEWCEVEIKDIITKYINDGKLDDFVLVYRYYSDGTEKPMCYFDSVKIVYTPKEGGIQQGIQRDSHLTFRGAQIRITGKQGLRFIFEIADELYETLDIPPSSEDTGVGFGAVVFPKAYMEEDILTKESYYSSGAESYFAQTVPAVNIFKICENSKQYTACITDIPPENFETEYVAVPYATYISYGEKITVYGEQTTGISVFAVADKAYKEKNESVSVLEYIYENILVKVDTDYPR